MAELYTKASVEISQLQREILAEPLITTTLLYLMFDQPDQLSIFFEAALTQAEKTALDLVVEAHVPGTVTITRDSHEIEMSWTEFKALLIKKNMSLYVQYQDYGVGDRYRVFIVEGVLIWYCFVKHEQSPADPSDQLEFETDWLPSANSFNVARDSTGKEIVNPDSTHGPMQNYWVVVETANGTAPVQNRDWAVKTCWKDWEKDTDDPGGTVVSGPIYLTCTTTTLDIEPPFDCEVGGGQVHCQALVTSPYILVDVILVPDVPHAMGGSVQVIYGAVATPTNPLRNEARSMKHLFYNATYHTNKIRVVLHHAAGEVVTLYVMLHLYRDTNAI